MDSPNLDQQLNLSDFGSTWRQPDSVQFKLSLNKENLREKTMEQYFIYIYIYMYISYIDLCFI